MVDAAMVAGVFKDVDTTIRLLTQKHNADQSAKKAHTAMPAKITGLQHYMPKPQNQGQQQQPRPGPSNQTACTQKICKSNLLIPVESGEWLENYPGDRSIRLVVRNPDPAETELEDGPLPVPPPRSVSAEPISLRLPIKLEIKEEEEVKNLLPIKKEESPSSVTFSPTVEEISQPIRPVTTIPSARRSAFRNVPRIVTQASSEEPEWLFRTNLHPDTPPTFPSLSNIPTVPNSPEISNSNNPFSKFELVASKKRGSIIVETYKGRLADVPNLIQPQLRNSFERIFIPPNDSDKVAETVLNRLERQYLDNTATTSLFHNTCIHPTTEISNIPLPTRVSSSPKSMFKRTGEITPPGSKAREWVQLLEEPITKEMKRLDFEKGKIKS